jgi:LysM repeat protein
MAKKPYKFRQARKDAKAAAKKAFPGKVKSRRVDPKIKISAEDRLALREAEDTARKELGKKAYLSRAEYEAQQRAAREAFRERMREEFGEYGGKKAEPAAAEEAQPKRAAKKAAVKKAAVKKAVAKKAVAPKPAVKKAAVKKAAVPAATGEKKMTRAERSAANKARWKSMTPAERKNWAATRNAPAATADETPRAKNDAGKPAAKKAAAKKAAAPRYPSVTGKNGKRAKTLGQVNEAVTKNTPKTKRPTLAQLKRQEAKGLEEAKARVEARKAGAGAKPRGMKSGEKPGQQPAAKAKPSVKPAAVSKGSKLLRKVKGAGKLGIVGALAAETYGLASGSTADNVREIQRLENKLASLTGKRDSAGKTFVKGMGLEVGQLANLSTLGIVGKNRRQRMDELNALIAKEQAKQAKAQAKANAKLRYGPGGESLVPGTAAYKAGSKTRPTKAQVTANFQAAKGGTTGGTGTGGAGSTIKVTPGSSYTVKKGDTLSAIAKSAGVSLADLRAANKKFKTNPKYKQGSMIFSGTTVKIPKKK